MVSDDLIHR